MTTDTILAGTQELDRLDEAMCRLTSDLDDLTSRVREPASEASFEDAGRLLVFAHAIRESARWMVGYAAELDRSVLEAAPKRWAAPATASRPGRTF